MTKKSNGKMEIELQTLNPAKFQTLQEVRDFVTGEGARALRSAIEVALRPQLDTLDMIYLGDALREARDGAYSLNHDLETLARVAVEWEGDTQPTFYRPPDCDGDKRDRRSLLYVTLRDENWVDWLKRELTDHLGAADAVAADADNGSAEGESIDDCRLSAISEVIVLDEAKQPELMGDAGAVATVNEECLVEVFYRPECTLVEFVSVAEGAIRKSNELARRLAGDVDGPELQPQND